MRNKRPVGLSLVDGPSKKHPTPEKRDDGWFIPDPTAGRLHQKSALGNPTQGGIIISDIELMFCHWHRHIPLPDMWLESKLQSNPDFVYEVVAFDVIRSSGDKVCNVDGRWMVWRREENPKSHQPMSEVKWFKSKSNFEIPEILKWVSSNAEKDLYSDIAIVDDEMDVTIFRLQMIDPTGDLTPATREEHPLLGIEHLSRVFLRQEEIDWLNNSEDEVSDLFGELNSRGLLVRPGFKYGCRWRVYSTPVEDDHAPWLMQLSSESPKNWEGVCLSVRLAEGVNKNWVIAIKSGIWQFLNFRRHLPGR